MTTADVRHTERAQYFMTISESGGRYLLGYEITGLKDNEG